MMGGGFVIEDVLVMMGGGGGVRHRRCPGHDGGGGVRHRRCPGHDGGGGFVIEDVLVFIILIKYSNEGNTVNTPEMH